MACLPTAPPNHQFYQIPSNTNHPKSDPRQHPTSDTYSATGMHLINITNNPTNNNQSHHRHHPTQLSFNTYRSPQHTGHCPCDTWHAPIGQLKQAILQKHLILLVSNALVSAHHTGMCAWTIWSTTHLWSRESIIPSTKDDLDSGLAKAYGIFTVLQFFQHYLSYFPLVLLRSASIKLYCDSQSVLD